MRWERSSSEISAIGAKAETVPISEAKVNGELTGETGLKTIVDWMRWKYMP